jgi:hypothetical protein
MNATPSRAIVVSDPARLAGTNRVAIAEDEQSHDDRDHDRVGREQRAEAKPVDDRPAEEGSKERSRPGWRHSPAEREPTRAGGAVSASVASIRPVFPRPSDCRLRASANVHTFGATAAKASATNAATKDRMMSGLPSVAIRERAPEREEWQTHDRRDGRDGTDPKSNLALLDPELRQVKGRECGDLPNCADLAEPGDREEDHHPTPA